MVIEIVFDESSLEFTVDPTGGWAYRSSVTGPIGDPEIYIVNERGNIFDYRFTRDEALDLAYQMAFGHAQNKAKIFNHDIVDNTNYEAEKDEECKK